MKQRKSEFSLTNSPTRNLFWRSFIYASFLSGAGLMVSAASAQEQSVLKPEAEKVENSAQNSEYVHTYPTSGEDGGISQDPREAPTNAGKAFKTPFGQIVWSDIAKQIVVKDKAAYVNYHGFKLRLTLNPDLQAQLEKEMDNQRHISGAIVMMESQTGRILAMAERRGEARSALLRDSSFPISARAPAASLMKIVTASAAIEKTGIEPEAEIPFHGGCGSLRNQNWLRDARSDTQKLSLARAFGSSCNTVFSRLAIYWTGLATFREYAERFMFNKPIPSDLLLETSAAFLPSFEAATAHEVGLAGAGFGATRLSPVHSAMLSAVAGNGGVMMAPFLVDAAFDANGKQVYVGQPREIGRVYSRATAEKMMRLMQETVLTGTSRRYFRRKGTARDLFDIGGKTGTLCDPEERSTLYTWFSGLAPLDAAGSVSIGTLVASPNNWVVRASSLAQVSLAHYLRMEKHAARVAGK